MAGMALSVCWLLDEEAERSVRDLWRRLEVAGVPSLLSHTHGRHVPHLTLAAVPRDDLDLGAVRRTLSALPSGDPLPLRFDALGVFPRSRCWLATAPSGEMIARQQRVARAVTASGARLHRHYLPGAWIPHLTLAPRLRLDDLGTVSARVNETLPLAATVRQAALVDTSVGRVEPLPLLL